MFRRLTTEQRAVIVADALARYLDGAELRDIAPGYNVHEKTLYQLIRRTDPEGWWHAQYARFWEEAEAASDDPTLTFRQMKSKVNAAHWRLDRLEKRRPPAAAQSGYRREQMHDLWKD